MRALSIGWLAPLLLTAWAAPARAQQVLLQTQLIYTLSETGFADGHTESSGSFSPLYVLTLRGPLIGGTKTLAELAVTSFDSGDPEAAVDQKNYRLNLFARGDRLNLTAIASRDRSRSTRVNPDGTRGSILSVVDYYYINGILSYPAYPHLSFQFQKSKGGPEDRPDTETTNLALAARYDWRRLHLLADHVRTDSGSAAARAESTRYGVSYARSLLPTVRFSLDHYSTLSTFDQGGGEREIQSRTTRLHLSALPTPFLVIDGEFEYDENDTSGPDDGARLTNRRHALHLRSEVLPRVYLDANKNGREQRSGLGTTSFDHTSASVGMQVRPGTILLAQWGESSATDPAGRVASDDEEKRVSLSTALRPQTELFADYQDTSQSSSSDRFDLKGVSLGLRQHVSPELSLGATVYQEKRRTSDLGGSAESARTRTLSLDTVWRPSPRWDLDLTVDLTRTDAARDTWSLTPRFGVRWDVDPATQLSLRSTVRHFDQDDGVFASADTSTNVIGQLTRRLSGGGIFEITYDYRRAASSVFDWERVLELRYTRNF